MTHVFWDVQVEGYRHCAELDGAEGVEGTCEVRSIIWEDSGAWLGFEGAEQQL